jgi:arylsulfatase A-like enzyme
VPRLRGFAFAFGLGALLVACGEPAAPPRAGEPSGPGAIRLVTAFRPDAVSGGAPAAAPPPPTELRFDPAAPPFEAGPGAADLAVREGRLAGRSTSDAAVLRIDHAGALPENDFVHAVLVRMRASAGRYVRMQVLGEPTPFSAVLETPHEFWSVASPLVAGPELRTYTLRGTQPLPAASVRHLFVAPTDAADASFEIESIQVVFQREHLAGIPSGPGWHGLGEIYRESLVARAPETIRLELVLPERAWLDLGIGTVEDAPVTFRVAVARSAGESVLLERTLTTAGRWENAPVDLSRFGGEPVTLSLSLRSPEVGAIGFWGAPVVRSGAPRNRDLQGVILIQADTLRRDHLDVYGYERETAPVLRELAAEGALFQDCVAQATWTKVSSSSMLLSLYPSSHGIVSFGDRLPDSAVTLAEVLRDAGFATLSLSSVFFTGKLTNLQQGFEELHESTSLPELRSSKTARVYVDRLLPWLEAHREVPFFVYLHVFDPHDPFRPRRPYDALFGDPSHHAEHERQAAEVRRFIQNPLLKSFGMPNRAELLAAGFDPDVYAARERDWYDGSIRAMDVELGRLVERLRELGLAERTLVVFTSDHGEEFLEHGRMFHGQSVYGELSRIPLVLWGPGRVPGRRVVAETVQSIDILPTVLELAGVAPPPAIQGQSLVPLLEPAAEGTPARFVARPAITEKRAEPDPNSPTKIGGAATAIVQGGFKLVHQQEPGDGASEYELYDLANDPLDRNDVAAEHPDVVRELVAALEAWRAEAAKVRLVPEAPAPEALAPEELERLRALGYVE